MVHCSITAATIASAVLTGCWSASILAPAPADAKSLCDYLPADNPCHAFDGLGPRGDDSDWDDPTAHSPQGPADTACIASPTGPVHRRSLRSHDRARHALIDCPTAAPPSTTWTRGRLRFEIHRQGTGLAFVGAYVLAGELAPAWGDHPVAFAAYEDQMRDYVNRVPAHHQRLLSAVHDNSFTLDPDCDRTMTMRVQFGTQASDLPGAGDPGRGRVIRDCHRRRTTSPLPSVGRWVNPAPTSLHLNILVFDTGDVMTSL